MDLKRILDAVETTTGIKPTAFSSKTVNSFPSITYQAYRESDDGVKELWRFQTRISCDSYAEAIEIDAALAEALCTVGDEEKHGCLYIAINGGGTLEDDTTGVPQIITYYDLLTRS